MRSIDIANLFIVRHGEDLQLTNLSLNKLVYFAQVEALRRRPGKPLFDDVIEAWDFGPVEPAVYHAFKKHGNARITTPSSDVCFDGEDSEFVISVVDSVANDYGSLTAFDLVDLSHRDGSPWKTKYTGARNVPITVDDIMQSSDFCERVNRGKTLGAAIQGVQDKWPNALRMLQDA